MNNFIGGYGVNGPIDWIYKNHCGYNKDNEFNEFNGYKSEIQRKKYEKHNKYFWEYNDDQENTKILKIIIFVFIIVLIGSLIPTLILKFQSAKNNDAGLGLFIPTIVLLFFFVCAFFLKCRSTRRTWMILSGFGAFICMMLLLFIDPLTQSTYKLTTEELLNLIFKFIILSSLMIVSVKYA